MLAAIFWVERGILGAALVVVRRFHSGKGGDLLCAAGG